MSADTPSVDEVRAQAQAVVDRARSDSDFSARLKADPEGTLRESGLTNEAVPDFARELVEDVEVEAHRPCTPFTCLITACPLTDW